jgi:hypothetical protein
MGSRRTADGLCDLPDSVTHPREFIPLGGVVFLSLLWNLLFHYSQLQKSGGAREIRIITTLSSMNHIRLRTRRSALGPLCAFLLTLCFYFPGLANANNQISGGISTTPTEGVGVEPGGCNLKLTASHAYDHGYKALSP